MKGFFSVIVGALVAFFFITLAAFTTSSDWNGQSNTAQLDSRLVAERMEDASRFLNQTFIDALLDSVYLNCGCGVGIGAVTPGDIFSNYSSRSASYVNSSLRNLSSQFINASATVTNYTFSVSSCNSTFEAVTGADILVNSSISKKSVSLNYSHSAVIYRDAGEFNATLGGLSVRVRCS